MFSFLFHKVRKAITKLQRPREYEKFQEETPMQPSIAANIAYLKEQLGESTDIIYREINMGSQKALIVFVDGLVKPEIVNEYVIESLMSYGRRYSNQDMQALGMQEIAERIISVGEISCESDMNELLDACLSGDTLLFLDNVREALVISTKGWDKRPVGQPETESVVRGPREGFTENLRTNTALLRRRIKTPQLTFESLKLGRATHTRVCLAYIKGIAEEKMLREVRRRLSKIDTDAILESGYVEEFIEEAPFSIFSTVGTTEKPDVATAKLLEGRAALIIDGTPIVLTVPLLFIEHFQTAEDYYIRPMVASFLRVLRYICYGISILAPALYVSLSTFHQELIPTPLLFTMASAQEGVPFPAVIEAGVMLFAFEILREGGLRLPNPIGQAMSIVGALVMGDAAVSAGLIGAPMVIVVALTAMSGFAVPSLVDTGAILRFIFLILSSLMGGISVVLGLLFLLIYLSSLKSFGHPFLAPLAPHYASDMKDTIMRMPHWLLLTRPRKLARENQTRQIFSPPEAEKSRKEQDDETI